MNAMKTDERLGTITVEGERASIFFERRLPYPIQTVWKAITDPHELAVWFGPVTLEPRAGGSIVVDAGPEDVPLAYRHSAGKILVWEPPHVLEFEWHQAIIEFSTLRYELTEDGAATTLKLLHRWLSVKNAKGFIPGWHSYLDRLAAYLGGEKIQDWRERFNEVMGNYAE
jgi:uncharacterized protein YndB with AHSA1/START domain